MSVNGQSDQHTLGHIDCPACKTLGSMSILVGSQPFSDACLVWLENHAQYIKPRTLQTYKQYAKTLAQFFETLPLGQFHIGNVRAYQRWRTQTAGATRLNGEVSSVCGCGKIGNRPGSPVETNSVSGWQKIVRISPTFSLHSIFSHAMIVSVSRTHNPMGALKSSKCSKGHRLIEGNLYVRKDGQRQCRKCQMQRAALRRKEQRSKAA